MTTTLEELLESALTRLLPCPFCGGNNVMICADRYEPEDRYSFFVSCSTAQCHGAINQLDDGLFASKEAAVAAWNTRAPSTLTVGK